MSQEVRNIVMAACDCMGRNRAHWGGGAGLLVGRFPLPLPAAPAGGAIAGATDG